MTSLTIQIDDQVNQELLKLSEQCNRTPEEIAGEMLRRSLWIKEFEKLQKIGQQYALAAGYTSEEQILRDIS